MAAGAVGLGGFGGDDDSRAGSCFVLLIGPHSGLRDWAYKKQRLEIGPR